MKKKRNMTIALCLVMFVFSLSSCGTEKNSNVTEIELVNYKPEAVKVFDQIEKDFNKTHKNIHLTITSPNDAMTVLKTRFIREDYPDIVGIGGDINYSNFLDADMFMDISDLNEVSQVKKSYLDMDKQLEFIPKKGVYALPYAANAAGILYNKDIFEKYGWSTPTTWNGLLQLCNQMKAQGVAPFYFGFKDTWTTLAPFNALAVSLTSPDVTARVNENKTTFVKEYPKIADKMKELVTYAQPDPYAYGYNDACTAFARGESAMYTIGSYAVPQIKSVNPDINIGTFVFPANNDEKENILNSGIDLQFCVLKDSKHKKEVYEVLNYLYQDDTIKKYIKDQNSIPCKEGDFQLPEVLEGVKSYVDDGKMADYQDHHYPSEMGADAMIQTFLMDDRKDATNIFLKKFDKDWIRYNRDLIEKIKKYNGETK